jgi:hypothetical protein
VDAHLVIDEVPLGKQNIELTGCEKGTSLRSISIKVTGDTRFNSGGVQRLQSGSYKWWGDWGRGGDVSCRLLVTHGGYKSIQGFVHGSGSLRLLIQPLLHLLEPFFIYGRGVDDYRQLSRRWNRGW